MVKTLGRRRVLVRRGGTGENKIFSLNEIYILLHKSVNGLDTSYVTL